MPGEEVKLILEIDNSQCTSDISSISVSVDNTVTMRSQGASTSSHNRVAGKTCGGLPAAMRRVVLYSNNIGKLSYDGNFHFTRGEQNETYLHGKTLIINLCSQCEAKS